MSTCLVALLRSPRPERFLERLRSHGVVPHVFDVTPGMDIPTSLASTASGLLVIAGPVSPYDERSVPFRALGSLVAVAVARQIPTFGIGGGAHVIAVSLGGRASMPGSRSPVGLRRVTRTAQGRLDVLFRHSPDAGRWIECSHLSMTDPPIGSHVLAVDEDGLPQAVRFGPSAWGIQGHPEVDSTTLQVYLSVSADLSSLVREGGMLKPDLVGVDQAFDAWLPVFDEFAALVRTYRTTTR